MAKMWPKVVGGCAIGCAVVVLGVVAAGFGGWKAVQGMVRGMESAGEARAGLEHQLGRVRDWTPPLDGRIPADRMEVFLAVRDDLTQPAASLSSLLATLDGPEGDKTTPGALRVMQAGFQFLPTMGAYCEARDRALLDAGMGPGEWAWIQILAYHSWLGYKLIEPVRMRTNRPGGVRVEMQGEPSHDSAVRHARGDIYAMMRNLRDALDASDDVDPDWRAAVGREMTRLRDEPDRIPWQDGLPDRVVASLEPFRDRLESSWDERTGVFNLVSIGSGGHPLQVEAED
jgi:hypothetical protein